MINRQLIYKIMGSLLFTEASLMFWCLVVSIFYQEDDSFAFSVSIIFTLFSGYVFRFLGLKATNSLGRRDAYLVVTLVWVIFSIFGSLPFIVGGYIDNFTDAFFEMMSGFTTTGATIIDDVERLPHGLLFWRTMTQWIGGLGIVFFTIAVLPSLVGGSIKVFSAEATGPVKTKLHPRLSKSSKTICAIYTILTVACGMCYYLAGMDVFDSVNYAMTTTATGGFATHNTSTEFFNSASIEYICTAFCFLSGINFTILYAAVTKLQPKYLLKSGEFRFYCLLVTGFTAMIMAELMLHNGYTLEHAFRSGIFQVVSFITTTGLFNDDASLWPHVTWVILATCMFIGACSGSTSGGFKCIRDFMLFKVISNQFKQNLHPNAVLPMKINGTNIPMAQRVTLLAFLTVTLLICLVCSFVLIAAGIDNTNAITITLSCISNVGPTLGIEIGPTMSWSMLPVGAKWLCTAVMLIGRLEIFSVLILFTPSFWKRV